MQLTFLGQELLGPVASAIAVPMAGGVQLSGILTASTFAGVTAAQDALAALVGLTGPLVVPTGFSAVPSASGVMVLTGPVAPGGAALPVGAAPGVVSGTLLTLASAARPGIMEVVTATGPISAGAVPITVTRHGYQVGDLATTGPLSPYFSLMPGGPNTPLPGNELYPGWDCWPSVFLAPGLFFGAITGTGPYECTYLAQFTNAVGGAVA